MATNGAPATRPTLLWRLRDMSDGRAWQEFVQLYTPLVFGFARRRGLQEADAADVAQEVMRTVARNMERFEYDPRRGTFRSWLFTVARSKFNNFLESRRHQPQAAGETTLQWLVDAEPCPAEDKEWDEEYHQHIFQWACEQVRGEFQDSTWNAFWRTAVEDNSGKEVAAELGLSVGAVYIARSRVTARLQEKVREVCDEIELTEGPPAP